MDKNSELFDQGEETNNQNIIQNYPTNEENTFDHFISDFQIDEEEEKIKESRDRKLLWLTERDNKNEEKYALKKEDMRKKTRQKQKENKNKKKKEKYYMLKQLTEEEKDRFYQAERQLQKDQEENLARGLTSSLQIIFDLEFVNLMKYKEMKSLVTQVAFCYGLNRRIKLPFNYHLCGYSGDLRLEFERMGSSFWHVNLYENFFYENEKLMENKDKFIYLSPDSPNNLEDFGDESIFIIGGFVDKPVSKNRTLFKAKELGIKTAKLPLEDYIEDIRNNVLNINTVVEILANFQQSKEWKSSIESVLPKRMIESD